MNFVAGFFLTVLVLAVSELYLLVYAAAALGFGAALALCVLTGIVGGAMVRHQGLKTLARLQSELTAGRLPATELIEGIALLIVGALLCVPGFITDVLGGLMLIPPLRHALASRLARAAAKRVQVHTGGVGPGPFGPGPFPPGSADRGDTIPVDVIDVKDAE